MDTEPWYGVRLVFHFTDRRAYEERIIILRAASLEDALQQADRAATEYEDESIAYTGCAVAFHIFDEAGPSLGPGTEVFSLIRESELGVNDYLDQFYDTGKERIQRPDRSTSAE